MGSSPTQQKIYRDAVAGIPRVVQAISGLPSKHHPEALAAAGRGYRETILQSGIAEPTADRMVATLLRRLQSRLAKERSVRDKVMRALHAELIPSAAEKRAPKKKRRSPKKPPQTEPQPPQTESQLPQAESPTPQTESPPVQDDLDAELGPVQKSPTTSPE